MLQMHRPKTGIVKSWRHVFVADTAVYSKYQQLRVVGAGKLKNDDSYGPIKR
ncbi:hypothetical protein HaLaN_07992, partial [Haematococcus lacustris]